jgi:hypothetical protein
LYQFLTVGHPDVVAAFADSLDIECCKQLKAITQLLNAVLRMKGKK